MHYMFQGCIFLNKLNLSSFDTQNVTDMSSMFEGCTELKNLNLGNFVFHNGCKMENIFLLCNFDNLCLPNTRKRCWCCCGRYVDLKGKVAVKLNQNNVEFEVVKYDPVSNEKVELV
jgi:surface protein